MKTQAAVNLTDGGKLQTPNKRYMILLSNKVNTAAYPAYTKIENLRNSTSHQQINTHL